jgi:hypothetical protein
MSIPAWLRGRYFPQDVAGYPVPDAEPVRNVGPNPDSGLAQTARRGQLEDDALQRALERMAESTRRLAG